MSAPTLAVATYCERTGTAFWAEPVNALTNLVFLVATVLAARALLRSRQPPRELWDLWLLVALAAAVGTGSFLWHTLATPWSALADVIPILLFISVFLLSFLIRVAQLSPSTAVIAFLAFQAVNVGVQRTLPADLLNGSVFYLPTWGALLLAAGYARAVGYAQARPFLLVTLAFTCALVLRTLDRAICDALPLGTHFAWHLLNGYILYAVTVALVPVRHGRRELAASADRT